MKRVGEGLLAHYGELWNWINLIWLVCALVAIPLWIIIISDKFRVAFTTDDPLDFESYEIIDGVSNIISLYKSYE